MSARGLRAPVGLDDADDHIDPLASRLLGARKHGVGLADARRRPEKDLQLAARLSLGRARAGHPGPGVRLA